MTTVSSSSDGANSGIETGRDKPQTSARWHPDIALLPEGAPPLERQNSRLLGQAPVGQPHVILLPAAVKSISTHASSDLHSEVGGVLLGTAYRQEAELYVEVRAALPVHSTDHGPIHFTFDADAWSRVNRDRMEHFPNLSIVGWFHTHPGLGIFFSGDDVVVHTAAFVLPWHVALVVDPLSKQMGAFAWKDGELSPLMGLYEILPDDVTTTQIAWKMQIGAVWNESYIERVEKRRSEATPNVWERIKPVHALLLSLVAIALSLGILLGAVLPLSSQNEVLGTVVRGLAERTLEEGAVNGAASCPSPSLRIYAPLPDEAIAYGREITIVGTASYPEAASYLLEVRPSGAPSWWALGTLKKPIENDAFLRWDTASFAPGTYDMRLSALNVDGAPLPGVASCVVRFSLVTSSTSSNAGE